MREYIKRHSGSITTDDIIAHFGTIPVRDIMISLDELDKKGMIDRSGDEIVWIERK